MNVVVKCDAILSKKMEKLCADGEYVSLTIGPVNGNRAECLLCMAVKDGVVLSDIVGIGETSVILRPKEVSEGAPDVSDGKPLVSLFAAGASSLAGNPVIDRIAKTDADASRPPAAPAVAVPESEKTRVRHAAKTKIVESLASAVATPMSSLEELEEALSKIKDVPQPHKAAPKAVERPMTRSEVIAIEKQAANRPRLQRPMYISNECQGILEIADLGVTLKMNEIYEFSKLPVERLKNSRDLRMCLTNGLLRFRSAGEYGEWMSWTVGQFDGATKHKTIDTFGSVAQAEAAMFSDKQGASGGEDDDDARHSTDVEAGEPIIIDSADTTTLIKSMPKVAQPSQVRSEPARKPSSGPAGAKPVMRRV